MATDHGRVVSTGGASEMSHHVWSEEAKKQAFVKTFALTGDATFELVKPMIGLMLDAAFAVDGEAITKEATYAERDRCMRIADRMSAYEFMGAYDFMDAIVAGDSK